MPGNKIRKRGWACAIRDGENINTGHGLEQFACHVAYGSDASRSHGELAWIGLGIGDELRNGLNGKRWIDSQDEVYANDTCHRRNVAQEIEIELVVKRRVDCISIGDKEKRIAVWSRIHDRLSANVAAAAWTIVNNDGLTELFRQPLF